MVEVMLEHRFYIIIVTYNASQWIRECLESIRLQNSLTNVVIVDNNSTDDTINITREFLDVTLLPQKKNLGFGGGNNLGAAYAIQRGAEYIFLLNQDTRLRPDCLQLLLDVLDNNPKVAVASPMHLNRSGGALDIKFENYISSRSCPGFISDAVTGNLREYYSINFVNAAGWMVRTAVVKKIGLFSPEFFHYGEDSNFLSRVSYFKYEVVIVPRAEMHHDRDERAGEMPSWYKEREVRVKMNNIMLNINISLKTAYWNLLRYAGQIFFTGRRSQAVRMYVSAVIRYRHFKKVRNAFMSEGFKLPIFDNV